MWAAYRATIMRSIATSFGLDFIVRVQIIDGILERRSSCKEFSKTEKRIVENTILMARLLYEMTKTTVVVKQENTDKLESINKAAIAGVQKNVGKLLALNS